MSVASGYGIDSTSESHVTWCKCGWRDVTLGKGRARTILVRHMETNHDVPPSTTMRIRSPKQRAMWADA